MGILSAEQYDAMVEKMEAQASTQEEPEAVAEAQGDPGSDDSQDLNPAEDGSSADTADVKGEVEGDVEREDAPKVPDSIPYGRFKEVNDKFRSKEQELQYAMARVRELEQLTLGNAPQKKQPTPEPAPQSDDEWLKGLLGGDPSDEAMSKLAQEVNTIKGWQQERTRQLVTHQLQSEIDAAVGKHPEVRPDELWQAVALDGSVDVKAVAESLHRQRTETRERYMSDANKEIADLRAQLEEAEKQAAEKPEFRRPSGSSTSSVKPTKKPRTVAEATNALAAAIRERMST